MITTTITNNKTGERLCLEKQTHEYLKMVKSDYLADCKGMAEGGEVLTDSFEDYVDYAKLVSFEGGEAMAKKRLNNFIKFYGLE
jgi:hypothetical protein